MSIIITRLGSSKSGVSYDVWLRYLYNCIILFCDSRFAVSLTYNIYILVNKIKVEIMSVCVMYPVTVITRFLYFKGNSFIFLYFRKIFLLNSFIFFMDFQQRFMVVLYIMPKIQMSFDLSNALS